MGHLGSPNFMSPNFAHSMNSAEGKRNKCEMALINIDYILSSVVLMVQGVGEGGSA